MVLYNTLFLIFFSLIFLLSLLFLNLYLTLNSLFFYTCSIFFYYFFESKVNGKQNSKLTIYASATCKCTSYNYPVSTHSCFIGPTNWLFSFLPPPQVLTVTMPVLSTWCCSTTPSFIFHTEKNLLRILKLFLIQSHLSAVEVLIYRRLMSLRIYTRSPIFSSSFSAILKF